MSEPLLSYCVVNTNGREHLLACLEAIAATHPPEVPHEVLVLDNASDDGSVAAVEALGRPDLRLIALERRRGKAENDTALLSEARGRYCLLLNEDAELQRGAARALLDALEGDPRAAAAGSQLLTSDGEPKACAWRLPGLLSALAPALLLPRLAVQSTGEHTREVGWCQSSAMLVRREAAAAVGYLDPGFFVYSDETDLCKRLHDAGWRVLYVPAARAVHHDQLSTDIESMRRRIVEFHRGRERYMRKHRSAPVRLAARLLWTLAYLERALGALLVPGHDPRRYLIHARHELLPGSGVGIREAAEARNRRLRAPPAGAMRPI
jgi:N-acetylglucosaminyl-diphospho-decaprenol L-rhamnosyltransferase